MPTYNKFNAFVQAIAHKIHDLSSDQITVALTNTLPDASTAAVLADITEIAYTNLSARNLTTSSSAQTSGTYKLTLADLTLTASGGSVATFQHVVLYNSTVSGGALIGFYSYPSAVTMLDGETFLIDMDAAAGLLTLA